MDDEQTRNMLIELGFAFNDCIAEAAEIIGGIHAEVDGLERRASLLLRAATVQTVAQELADDVLWHLDALDRAA